MLNNFLNRITLDFVRHDLARKQIQKMMNEKGMDDRFIRKLHIVADDGYIYYEVDLIDETTLRVFDDGSVMK